MRKFKEIEKYLLSNKYKKAGKILLAITPLIWLIIGFTHVFLNYPQEKFASYWNNYGLILLHMPISLSLYFILLAKEKTEDEMFARLRMEAIIHGVRFIVYGVFAIALIGLLLWFLFGVKYGIGALGGEMAVVTLLLLYANVSYFLLRREYVKESA